MLDEQRPSSEHHHTSNSSGYFHLVLSSSLLKLVLLASIGGLLFGYDLGVISCALPQVTEAFALTKHQQESVVSYLFIGAGAGSACGGILCDTFGRRRTILLTDLVFCVGGLLLSFAPSFSTLLVGRAIVGFGVSVSGIADVAYLTEISPSSIRGSLVSCNEACISLGFLVSYLLGVGLNILLPTAGWRWMFGFSAFIGAVQFAGMYPMPESPVWLADHGMAEEARAAVDEIFFPSRNKSSAGQLDNNNASKDALVAFHEESSSSGCCIQADNDKHAASVELHHYIERRITLRTKSIVSGLDSLLEVNDEKGIHHHHPHQNSDDGRKGMWSNLSEILVLHKQISVTLVLSVSQMFCGHANVLNFAPELFAKVGFSKNTALGSILLLGCVKCVTTILVIMNVEAWGRRWLLIGGVALVVISHIIIVSAFSESVPILAVVGTVGIAVGYASSFGPMAWLITSEMFPSNSRGRALGFASVVTYISGAFASHTFLSFQEKYEDDAAPFKFYFTVTLLSLFFFAVAVPDTGSKSPSEIDRSMSKMWLWRKLRQSSCVVSFSSGISQQSLVDSGYATGLT